MNNRPPRLCRFFRRLLAGGLGLMLLGVLPGPVSAEDWSQWRGPRRDGVWRETGLVEEFRLNEQGRIRLRWSVAIGAGYSQPTVAHGRVYVTDRLEEPEEIERVHCFDFATGRSLWSHVYPAPYNINYKSGPRAAVTVEPQAPGEPGRAYALGAVGHLFCFDAATGQVLWARDLQQEYKISMPRWGIAGSPLIEGDLLIVQIGGKVEDPSGRGRGACVVAFDKRSGKERWRAHKGEASYAAPLMIQQAGRRVLVVYAADDVLGLDPATGEELWSYAMPGSRWPISIATPVPVAHEGSDYLFITNEHVGSALLRLEKDSPAVTEIWRRNDMRSPDNLHALIPTPLVRDGHVYGAHAQGELRCLELLTGRRLWEDHQTVKPDRFATAHVVAHGDTGPRVWIFNEHGELILAELSPQGYRQISRARLLDPTPQGMPGRRGGVVWSHPAFAQRHVIARNDKELVCADLGAEASAEP